MSASLSPLPKLQFFDANGNPLVGGRLYTFAAGTTTPLDTYTDNTGTIAASNPIILNGRGECEVWLGGAPYKFRLETSAGVEVWTVDNVTQANADQLQYTPAATSLLNGVVTTVSGGLNELSHQSTGSSRVGFLQAGSGAQARTVQSKLRDVVSVKDFGAVGDGVADDTVAFQNAVTYCVANGYKLYIPGKIRITQGVTLSTNYRALTIIGETYSVEPNFSSAGQSQIILDSASAASYFLNITGRTYLSVRDITFVCAQAATSGERKAIIFNANLKFVFDNVAFENVDRFAIYLENGCYFQTSALRDCQFRGVGNMFGSASNALKGTGLRLDNIQCASSLGTATTKIFCDLRGVRDIVANSVIMEGGITESGWTILRLDVLGYEAEFTRNPFADFTMLHLEWAGTAPAVGVQQNGGTVRISDFNSGIQYGYSLNSSGFVVIERTSFGSTTANPATNFTLSDLKCQVILRDCIHRLPQADPLFSVDGFIYDNVILGWPSEKPRAISNTAALPIFKWGGGIWEAEGGTIAFGAATVTNSTDATYKRKLLVALNGATFNTNFSIPTPSSLRAGDVVAARMLVKLPTFSGGQIRITRSGYTTNGDDLYFPDSFSGQIVPVFLASVLDSSPTSLVYSFSQGTVPSGSASGSFEIYSFEVYAGINIPRPISPLYPPRITTSASAAPTTGTWAVGDRVFNSAPAIGQPKSWVCTVAGTPGTWVSEGNL